MNARPLPQLPREPRGAPSELPRETVSVVVIGRNEGERLARCLAAVNRMSYPAELVEKIYVDSDSADGSAERAAEAGFTVLHYRAEFRTAAGARDMGWRAAQSSFVLFLDGDCAIDPAFVGHAVACCRTQGAAAVSGRIREIHAEACARRRTIGLHWEVNRKASEGESFYGGGCSLVERAALEAINGYNVELAVTENNDLGRRIGASGRMIWFLDRPMVMHDSGVKGWTEIFRRCVRNGYWFERYCSLPGMDAIAAGPADVRASAAKKTIPTIAAALAGSLLAGGGGAVAGAGVMATASLWKRAAKVRRVKGPSWSNIRDGALLGFYDFSIWCGRLRFLAERVAGKPRAFQTGPDWRSS